MSNQLQVGGALILYTKLKAKVYSIILLYDIEEIHNYYMLKFMSILRLTAFRTNNLRLVKEN